MIYMNLAPKHICTMCGCGSDFKSMIALVICLEDRYITRQSQVTTQSPQTPSLLLTAVPANAVQLQHKSERSVFQIRKYRKTRVLSDQVGISLPAYSTHVLQQSKQTQTKAKSENVFVHSFIPSRIFQRRRSKIYFQPSQVKVNTSGPTRIFLMT